MYAPGSSRGSPSIKTALLALLVVFSAVGCSSDHGAVSRVPGTEVAVTKSSGISNDPYAISVSPDERYLFFWEWGITHAAARRDSSRAYRQAACVDLVTGEKTGFELDTDEEQWPSSVGSDFVPQCWYEGICYVPDRQRSWRVVMRRFDPESPRVTTTDIFGELSFDGRSGLVMPTAVFAKLTCSDCAPRGLLKHTIKKRLGDSWSPGDNTYRFSIPWSDGRLSDRLYHVRGSAIYVREDNVDTLLFEKASQRHRMHVDRLRVSPDESFIAFTLFKKIKAPIPLPDYIEEVHLLDLSTLESTLVDSYRYVGNYIWSPDSKRLYYSANGQDPDDMGVYVVDVPKLFGRSGDD